MADPGFPVGSVDLVGGAWTPEAVTFRNFVCHNERIWTLGGACPEHAPLDPPMACVINEAIVISKQF